ncbi:MAG: sugar phosphate isomerase/epimerase family protein [Opitutales bacterium]
MHWGYAGVWPGEYLELDKDPLWARLKFLQHHGLESTGIHFGALEKLDEAERDRVGQFLIDHQLFLSPHGRPGDYFTDSRDELLRGVERLLAQTERWKDFCRAPLFVTVAGAYHRFMSEPSLDFQMERLRDVLTPLCSGMKSLGVNVGIENHGDYYVSDLVTLCQDVPGLGIFLDTGNCFLTGERPDLAYAVGAPYTVGTHFKDHQVRPRPDGRPLYFEVGPSAIGEGHAQLDLAYRLIAEHAPDPDNLVMEIELIPPKGNVRESLEKSLAFIRSLEAGTPA